MKPASFKEQIGLLTGRPVAILSHDENAAIDALLEEALKNDELAIDCSQFNELLLIVNKDRVTEFFFQHFFGTPCAIKDIREGVMRFQKTAMLCFGNFIYAYRTLSKVKGLRELEQHVGDYCHEARELWSRFKNRSETILNIREIPRDRTRSSVIFPPARLERNTE